MTRLDLHLLKTHGRYSRSFYQKFIRKNGVEINGKKIKKPHCAIRPTNEIKIEEKEMRDFLALQEHGREKGEYDLKPMIIYSDKDFFAIDKPPFVTTEDLIKGFLPVHRLDKNTSGVLAVAKNPLAQAALQKQWLEKKVKKTYIALIKGKLEPREGAIEGPIGRSQKDRRKMALSSLFKARQARTSYKVIKHLYLKDSLYLPLTLVFAFPETGRTHQIRVHFSSITHPIVGDDLYGDKKLNKSFQQKFALNRQFLHALSLQISHPKTGKKIKITAKISDQLKSVLNELAVI